MEDLSLEDLTAQLQAVQEKKSVVRLSERNVVELVNRLKELGYLDASLLHTINGKEYLTHEQLKKEIEETLQSAGGRISLSELCNALNVDLLHCEKQSGVLVEQSDGAILSVQEELITVKYLDSIAVEIKERLQTTGMLRIGDLAIQYGLSHDLLLSVVSARLGSVLNGELLNSMLYTEAYRDRIKAQLRGALRGVTSPIMTTALLKQICLDESGTTEIVQKLIRDLIHQSHIKGEMRSNGQWVPDVHLKAQRSSVVSSFHQSGWVTLSAVRKVAPSEAPFIQEHFAEHCKLDSVLISHSFLETIDAEIEENMESAPWCDIPTLLPVDFSEEDVRLLLMQSHFLKQQPSIQRITDTCLATETFLEDCRRRTAEAAAQMAKDAFVQSKQDRKADDASASSAVKAKREDEDDDDWATDKGKGKKKGKGKNKAKAKTTGPRPRAHPTTASSLSLGPAKQTGSTSKEAVLMTNCPSRQSLVRQVIEWHPDTEDVAHLPEALADVLLSDAIAAYKNVIEEITKTTDKRRQELKETALKKLEGTLNQLWIFSKGIDALVGNVDDPTVLLLKKHLIKNTGSDALDWVLRYFQLQEPGADEEVPDEMIPIPPSVRSKLTEAMPQDVAPVATAAMQNMKQDDPYVVLESLDVGLESCGIRFPKRDKKAEKQKLIEIKDALRQNLLTETNPATLLATILPLIVAEVKGFAVSLPGRAMPAVMEYLQPFLKEDDYETLNTFHKAVVENLKRQSNPENITGQETEQETLSELIPKAKKLVQDLIGRA